MSSPSTSTRPAVGRSSAPIIDSSDVLPDPDGPVRATNSPGSSVSETSWTATISPGCSRRTCSAPTRAPWGPEPGVVVVCSAMYTDHVIEVLAAAALDLHDHPEGQREPHRAGRPG